MPKYRKKPVEIEAVRFDYPPSQELLDFAGEAIGEITREEGQKATLAVKTLEDGPDGRVKHVATEGDYIIRGVKGEFYACKPDIFAQTYEPVEE